MPAPLLRSRLFQPGQRVAIAVSGGADSVALLRRLLEERANLGLVLSVAHVQHGIRGAAAEADAMFVADLAAHHDLPFHLHRTDAVAAAAALGETLEEAARHLRYAFFGRLLAEGQTDAIVTAHTLDDQAETVLHKLIRGGWTEGLSGIHAVVKVESGSILRPFLDVTRESIEGWLQQLAQPWREDESNRDLAYTRNRIRWELLPLLRTFNPGIAAQLARMASIAGDEEVYWTAEMSRLLPGLLLPGKPTRGGGRSTSTHPEEETVAIELARLRELAPAVGRRVVRAAARRLGARVGFDHTEQLLALSGAGGKAGKLDLPGGVTAERSLRELRLTRGLLRGSAGSAPATFPAYSVVVPGEVRALEYGLLLRVEGPVGEATLRPWRAGDRVTIRYSRGPNKVAEVLDRLHVMGEARKNWPVVDVGGKVIWIRGAEAEPCGYQFTVAALPADGGNS